MADIRITNVPAATSVAANNNFYVKIGSNFRQAPISALITLLETSLETSGFLKVSSDGIKQDNLAVEPVVISPDSETPGAYVSSRTASQIYQAFSDNFAIKPTYEYWLDANTPIFTRGAVLDVTETEAVFAFLDFAVATPELLIFVVENYSVSATIIPLTGGGGGGGGGTAEVTAAAVAAAIGEMNTSQKNSSRQNLGAEAAGAAAAVQTNLNAVLALVPSNASANNQLATKGDLPTLTNRNSSTDTVEVKKDPTTQKLYVPTYPSGGAIAPADIVNATGQMTSEQKSDTRQNIGAEQSGAAAAVQTDLNTVKGKIPSAASSSNQLADKEFVNSSIATATATFRGTYTTMAQINAISTKDLNDYAFLEETDSAGNTLYKRYKYNGSSWEFEYTLNNSSFTAAQWAAINSGMTAEKVTNLPVFSNRNSSTDTVEVKQDPTTKKLYVPEGDSSSGPAIPTPTVGDNGKYLGIVNGAYTLLSAPSGSGATIYGVTAVYRSGYWYIQHDNTDIAAENIFTALGSGALVRFIDDAGAEGDLLEISYDAPGNGRLLYKTSNMDNNTPGWRLFEIVDTIVQGNPRANVTMTPVELLPVSDSRTAATIASGFTVEGNRVYTVSGTVSGFTLITSTRPTMLPGQCIEIRLTVGSTAITTPTWPSWAKFLNGWDGKFDANSYYKIIIDDVGNVMCGKREVAT